MGNNNQTLTIQSASAFLQDKGYFVTKAPKQEDYHFTPDTGPFHGTTLRFGVVADTHLGSIYQQLTHLHTFYQLCQEHKIGTIFHCGDLTDGQHIYQGHEYELFLHGADSQIDYVIQNYPRVPGITTYFICGNHDESHYKRAGMDVGKYIAESRKDMRYLGFHGAHLTLNGIPNLVYLHHGASGNAYARSYKIQKLVEQLPPGEKPYMLFEGHYHTACHLPNYRNVYVWQMPCFQAQTPFERRRALNPEVMGLFCEVIFHHGKPVAYVGKPQLFPTPMKDDY
jgi:hypothetical protein